MAAAAPKPGKVSPGQAKKQTQQGGKGQGKAKGKAKTQGKGGAAPAAPAPATTGKGKGKAKGVAKTKKVKAKPNKAAVQPAATTPAVATAAAAPAPAATKTSKPKKASKTSKAKKNAAAHAASVRLANLRATAARNRAAAAAATAAAPVFAPVLAAAGGTQGSGSSGSKGGRATKDSSTSILHGGSRVITGPVAAVTRIIEVIPPWIRWTILALALMAGLGFALAGLTARRARGLARQREALLADVGLLQSALLPPVPAQIGATRITAAYRPADGPAAGGDFYDAFPLPDGLACVVVGDLSGHGREALPLTALVRHTLRAYLEAGLQPRAALQAANAVLDMQLGAQLATVIVAVHDPRTGSLTYAAAGHPPPVRLAQPFEAVTSASSPPLGAGVPTGRRQTTLALPVGSAAVLHTDGLVDARVDGEPLGEDRLRQELEHLGPDAGAEALLAAVVRRTDVQPDDMAALVVRPAEGARLGAPAVRIEEFEIDTGSIERGTAERFLLACGVERGAAADELATARWVAARRGTAILQVHDAGRLPAVTVKPPAVEALPVLRARRSAVPGRRSA